MRCRRCTGSAPFNGSSSTSTCGSHTSAAATFVRWRMPLLNSSTPRSATSSISTDLQRVLGRAPVGDAVQVGDVAHELAGGEPARDRFVLGHEREPAEHLAIAARVAALDRARCPG